MTDMTGATDLCRMTPEQLLARVAQGDRAALDALYDGTAARLYAVCLALLEDRIAAEETLEETFLAVWRDAGTQPGSGLEAMAWLGAVACDRAGLRIAMRDAGPPEAPPSEALPSGRRAPSGRRPSPDRPSDLPSADLPSADLPDRRLPDRGLAGAVAGGERVGDPPGADEAAPAVAAFAPHAALVRELVPVMPPARARRRIRERLGHVAPPLSEVIDSRIRWWQRPWGVLTAAVALALLVLVGVALLRPIHSDGTSAESRAPAGAGADGIGQAVASPLPSGPSATRPVGPVPAR